MIGLTIRLIMGGGREALVRLVVTAVGVALGVALLLFAAVAFPALHSHDVRGGWRNTSAHNIQPAQNEAATDSLLWRTGTDNFDTSEIIRVDLSAEGPRSPVPPGLSRLPGPGEYAVSPALARLIASTPPDMLADRYPGHSVETIGTAALVGPDQLMVIVGHTPATMRAFTGVDEVRSIEAAPIQHGYNEFLRVMLAIGILGLILPVIVFVSTATRLAAARREQRLAALRLVGVTPRQTSALAAFEAGLAACAGTVLGFVAFAAGRPYAARIPFDGNSFFPTDLHLSALMAILIALGVPGLAAIAAELSLRRVRVSPLGVARQAPRPHPRWRRLILLAVGLIGFAIALPIVVANNGGTSSLSVMSVAFVVVVAGIVVAGPWLTLAVGSLMLRYSRGFFALLAGRRLQDDPAAGFRSISGLILAVFVASLICGVLPSAMGPGHKTTPVPPGAMLAYFGGRQVTGLDPQPAANLLRRLTATFGVNHVAAFRRAPEGSTLAPSDQGEAPVPVVMDCADLNITELASCPNTSGIVALDIHLLGVAGNPFLTLTRPVADTELGTLPLAGLVVRTTGDVASLERVRTAIFAAIGQREASVESTADENSRLNHRLIQLQRLVTIALLLTLLIAGCSLAVSVAGGLIERRRPFALLRLAGAHPADLRRVVLAETTAPLLTVAVISAGLGLALAAIVLKAMNTAWKPPDPTYWAGLAGGLVLALAISAATALPLLGRITSLETARSE
jgi:hypothetical protein